MYNIHDLFPQALKLIIEFSFEEANKCLLAILEYAKETSEIYIAYTYYWLSILSLLMSDFSNAEEYMNSCITTTETNPFHHLWQHSDDYYALHAIYLLIKKEDEKYKVIFEKITYLQEKKLFK